MPDLRKPQTWSEPEGSPQSGEPLYLAVGRLLRTHGLKGDLLMEILTDFPERIKTGQVLYVGSEHQALSNSRHSRPFERIVNQLPWHRHP